MGEALEVAKVLVEPTMKLLDMVGGAIGTAYEPRHKRKMADATAYEINAIADAMRNAADMPVVYNQDGVAINSEDFNRLMQRAGTRLVLQETIKQHNIESVIDNAYEILEKEEVCSEEPVEQGWINRFFDSVADVSNEDLQKLWGQLLAGETKKPGSFSFKTLDILKNLRPQDAQLFQSMLPFTIKNGNARFITSEQSLMEKYNINYGMIIVLDDLGLMLSNPFMKSNPEIEQGGMLRSIYTQNYLLALENKQSNTGTISFGSYFLTSAGKELCDLLSYEPNDNYFVDWVRFIREKNKDKNILFSVHNRVNHGITPPLYAEESLDI